MSPDSQGSRASLAQMEAHADVDASPSSVLIHPANMLMEHAHVQRQLRFQYLVRRYLSQVHFGCVNPNCTTPTCLSSQSRATQKPLRKPTPITSRTLAYFLATQDDPLSALCPSPLQVPPSSLEYNPSKVHIYNPERPKVTTHEAASTDNAEINPEDFWASVIGQRQLKRDKRSLGQNLFDTAASIYFYWRKLLHANHAAPLISSATRHQSAQTPKSITDAHNSITHSTETYTNGIVNPNVSSPPERGNGALSNGTPVPRLPGNHGDKVEPPSTKLFYKDSVEHVHSNGISRVGIKKDSTPKARGPDEVSGYQKKLSGPDSSERPAMNGTKTLSASSSNYSLPVTNGVFKKSPSPASPALRKSNPGQAVTYLSCHLMATLKESWNFWDPRRDEPGGISFLNEYDKRSTPRLSSAANRTLYCGLSNPQILLRSFREEKWRNGVRSPLPHLNPASLEVAFRDWTRYNGSLIFDSLWIALEVLFNPPPEISTQQKSPRLKPARKRQTLEDAPPSQYQPWFDQQGTIRFDDSTSDPFQTPSDRAYLSDVDAAHIIMISIHALTSLVRRQWLRQWSATRKQRSLGIFVPYDKKASDSPTPDTDSLELLDVFEYEPALRLAERLVRAIAARRCFAEILLNLQHPAEVEARKLDRQPCDLMEILMNHLQEVELAALHDGSEMGDPNATNDPGWSATSIFLEWLRTLVIKFWNHKTTVHRWSVVGAALDTMADLYGRTAPVKHLGITAHCFETPYFFKQLDENEVTSSFLEFSTNPNLKHILSYPFLFQRSQLIQYFRTINYMKMYKHYFDSECYHRAQWYINGLRRSEMPASFSQQMQYFADRYLVLDVRRNHILEDTFNQLWGVQARVLLRPLKVRLGSEEGEEGVDQGGVSLEFFRVALAEALNPDNGMFTVDPQTHMTWFQPASLEPDERYELLGMLFSLAVYNGITLPVTFPTAFYAMLLKRDPWPYLTDDWPQLMKSFNQLLNWEDGDVGDVFMRTYEFSFEALGEVVSIDMETIPTDYFPATASEWLQADPSNEPLRRLVEASGEDVDELLKDCEIRPKKEPVLVTNANRHQYVNEYLDWLVRKSIVMKYASFQKGFYSCLDERALALLDPPQLRHLVEGHQNIDIKGLQSIAQYEEGYTPSTPIVQDFWSIVSDYNDTMKRKLLEFVTASERVPVNGTKSLTFSIVRNGGDSENLPTSSTCFGKLLLPEYSSKEKLEQKLGLALMYSKGFGTV